MLEKFEDRIKFIKRNFSKAQAINIHRDALYAEMLTDHGSEMFIAINNIIHDEDVIYHFREDPDYAKQYIEAVIADGYQEEISIVTKWFNLAKALGPIKRRMLRKA